MTAVRQTAERRLVAVVAAVVFVDTLFYAAIAPLLPKLAHELGLSKLSAGVMTASYPLGLAATALTESTFWAPSMAMLSDAADTHGLDQGLAAALMNLAWAVGQILGSGVGGAVAKAASDGVPMGLVAGACLLTLMLLLTRGAARGGRGRGAEARRTPGSSWGVSRGIALQWRWHDAPRRRGGGAS